MKRLTIYYWICMGLLLAGIGIGSVFDVIAYPESVKIVTSLGYPAYLVPVLGIARLLGLTALLVPGFPRIKEWAFAGLVFDVSLAMYSILAAGNPVTMITFPVIILLIVIAIYILYHRRLKTSVSN
jgi:uncharacterized membrane protein YphA (DoxX/SURF4 family)